MTEGRFRRAQYSWIYRITVLYYLSLKIAMKLGLEEEDAVLGGLAAPNLACMGGKR